MKKLTSGFAILIAFLLITSSGFSAGKYTGTKGCIPCHTSEKKGGQAGIWKKSLHAQAYTALTTDKALEIAKAKGIDKPAESKECLPCHSVGTMVDPSMCKENFDVKDGVQCETCHGAGSDYRTMTIMKDKDKAVENGLILYKDDAAIEAKCRSCHNDKSPTFKEFVFKDRWEKIKHYMPK